MLIPPLSAGQALREILFSYCYYLWILMPYGQSSMVYFDPPIKEIIIFQHIKIKCSPKMEKNICRIKNYSNFALQFFWQ